MNIREKTEREKMAKVAGVGNNEITVTHLTIRQSIFFLILKLLSIEILAALCLILFLFGYISGASLSDFGLDSYTVPIFVVAVAIKTFFTFFTIVQWLEEYYEITPNEIIHRNGLIFKKEERHKLIHMKELEIDQTTLGKIFNFGTLRLNNWSLDRDVFLYLIHNPVKYHRVLEKLMPEVDTERQMLREHVLEIED